MITDRRWLRWLGAAVALAGTAFVARETWRLRADIAALATEPALFGVIVVGAVFDAAALTLLALGWAGLIRASDERVARGELIHIFAASSIAKYVPGNVFHFAGRQLLAGRLGVAQRRTAAATLTEALSALAAGITMAGVAIAGSHHALAAPALLSLIAVAAILGRRRPLVVMFGLACAFFLVSQVVIAALAAVLGASRSDLLAITAVYLVAWAGGNMLPGVPSGLGVREAAFVSLAAALAVATEPLAVMLAVAMRVVSLGGDLLFFVGGSMAGANPFSANGPS